MNSIEPKTIEGDLKKITKEAGITFVGVLFGIGLRYICAVIIARHVGALSFGVYALGLTIINLAQIVAIAGLNYGVLRFVSAHYSANEGEKVKGFIISALKLVLIGSLCIGVFLFIGADILAEKVFSKNELGLIIKWFSLSLPFLAVIEISVFSIQGIQALRYKVYVKAIFQQLLQLGIVSFYYLRKLFPDIAKRAMKADSQYTSLLRFSIPVLGMNILGFGMMWTDTLMVGYFMTSRDVGVYNAAAKTAFLLHIVLFSFSAIFMPMISDLSNRGDLEKLKSLLGTVTKWIFALSFPMFLLMAILSKHIMAIFGSEFIVALPCFLILALAQLISSSAGPLGNVLIMSGKQDIVFLDTAISCSLNVILNYILIGKYGIVGAAIATGLSIAFLNCAYLVEVYYYYQIHPYNRKILKPILSGIMASLVGLVGHSLVGAANPLYLFPTVIFIFILCYVMFLYIWGFDDEDKVVSHALLRRFSSVLKAS
jgi:O-antigen/teichoic acid export membrane protein